MRLPTLTDIFDLRGADQRHSHSKCMSFAITAAALVYQFTYDVTLTDLGLFTLLLCASHGLAGLRLWVKKNGGSAP